MRTIVFGGAGMLGRAVAAEWRRHGHAILALSRSQADVRDRAALIAHAELFRPQLIVNCAALTRVDDCETERELAFEVNGAAVANVAAAAAHAGADLVHVSTDYVFDGGAEVPYREDAATGPRSVYGESKLRGEDAALGYERALVLRTSWLFGPGGPNFVATICRLLRQGRVPLRVVDDQVGCPTYTPFLARAIRELATRGERGVLHYRNREAVSWHGFATEIAATVDAGAEVTPVSTAEFPRPAPRPAYSVLDVTLFEAATGRRVEPWIAGLVSYQQTLGNDS
jgi:dTDP-4-dehydrorhamnose reductase